MSMGTAWNGTHATQRAVAAQRPVGLVGMPGGMAAAGFLVKRLVVVEARPLGAHELAGYARQATWRKMNSRAKASSRQMLMASWKALP